MSELRSPRRRAVRGALCVVLVLSAGGCRGITSREATGTGIGAVVGGGAGYALGRHYGNRTTGTLIGAGVGGLLGYVVGDALDESAGAPVGGAVPISASTDRRRTGPGGAVVHPCPPVPECCGDPPPPCR